MPAQGDGADRAASGDRPDATPSRRRLWASRSPGRAVARYADGRILKGYADFDPEQPQFRLIPLGESDPEGVEVVVEDLKALFFVRTFDGNPEYDESKDLYQPRPAGTRKVSVRFLDGEELVGYTREFDRYRGGLFFVPLDPRSNNLRVFAVFDAISGVRRLL
jgi:hypothetical protein